MNLPTHPWCRGMLGWLHRERGVPLEQLSLSALLPSSGREGVSLVFDYLLWLSTERDISVRTEGLVVGGGGAWVGEWVDEKEGHGGLEKSGGAPGWIDGHTHVESLNVHPCLCLVCLYACRSARRVRQPSSCTTVNRRYGD